MIKELLKRFIFTSFLLHCSATMAGGNELSSERDRSLKDTTVSSVVSKERSSGSTIEFDKKTNNFIVKVPYANWQVVVLEPGTSTHSNSYYIRNVGGGIFKGLWLGGGNTRQLRLHVVDQNNRSKCQKTITVNPNL